MQISIVADGKTNAGSYTVTATVTLNDQKTCGTELFYNEMVNSYDSINNDFFKELVEGIRANDTWDEEKESFKLGTKLTSIYTLLGPVDFIETILSFDDSEGFKLPEIFEMVATSDQERTKRYIENANINLYKTDLYNESLFEIEKDYEADKSKIGAKLDKQEKKQEN